MLNKISIRLRLTMLSVLLLSLCCVGLTTVLNLSANRMANTIEATLLTPVLTINPGELPKEEVPPTDQVPLTAVETSQAAKTQFFNSSVFLVLFVIAIGGGLTFYSSGKALKPLQELDRQMKNRTVHNLSEVLPVPQSHDEIADLTRSFNEMSEKLEEAFAMQRRFSQSAAHELRTPLTVLKTKVDVFKKKQTHTPEEYDKLLSVITTHTNRLSDLVKDLLDLTNMDALDCDEPIALKATLTEVAEELLPLAKEKSISIAIDGKERTIQGNRSLLHRAFYNLVENAIKYNVEGGKVSVCIGTEKEACKISIADTGIGIAPELRQLIFEPFFRVDKSRSRQMGGAGLGLSTVKTILEKHDGTITVADNPDGGTVFFINL